MTPLASGAGRLSAGGVGVGGVGVGGVGSGGVGVGGVGAVVGWMETSPYPGRVETGVTKATVPLLVKGIVSIVPLGPVMTSELVASSNLAPVGVWPLKNRFRCVSGLNRFSEPLNVLGESR